LHFAYLNQFHLTKVNKSLSDKDYVKKWKKIYDKDYQKYFANTNFLDDYDEATEILKRIM
jgi:hypothetical protein